MKYPVTPILFILACTLLTLPLSAANVSADEAEETAVRVTIEADGETTEISAEVIVIELGDGKVLSIVVRNIEAGEVPIYAGHYPMPANAATWHSLTIYPGAANVVRIGVEEHDIEE